MLSMLEKRISINSSPLANPCTRSMSISNSELHGPPLGEAGPSASASKKRVRQKETEETQPSLGGELDEQNPVPMKKVRFHHSTIDNSLWADLLVSKHASERATAATSSASEDPLLPSSEEQATEAEATAAENPAPDPLASAVTTETPAIVNLSNDVEAVATNGDAENADEISSVEAEIDETDEQDEEEGSIPRSSPPPELRLESLNSPELSETIQKEEMKAIQNRRKTRSLPTLFMCPPLSSPTPLNPAKQKAKAKAKATPRRQRQLETPVIATSSIERRPLNLISRDAVDQSSRVLLSALSRLPEASAREAREALEQITRWQGQRGYQAGYEDGLKLTQPTQTKRAAE